MPDVGTTVGYILISVRPTPACSVGHRGSTSDCRGGANLSQCMTRPHSECDSGHDRCAAKRSPSSVPSIPSKGEMTMPVTIWLPGRHQRLITVIASWLLLAVILTSLHGLHGTKSRAVIVVVVTAAAMTLAVASRRLRVVLSSDYLTRYGYIGKIDVPRSDIAGVTFHVPRWTVSPVGCGASEAITLELSDGRTHCLMRRSVLSVGPDISEASRSLVDAIQTWLEMNGQFVV